jgi:hypothetical protein
VSNLAKRPDCADILNKFAEKLGSGKMGKLDATERGKTFIESVFDNLKGIVINDREAGSGARTDGDYIWVRNYNTPTVSKAHQNAAWAAYIIQEMVHDFRRNGGQFDDRAIDKAARAILDEMSPTAAAKIRSDFTAMAGKLANEDGYLAHYLVKLHCQYTQKEIDNGQPK